MEAHTVLVAFVVNAENEEHAQRLLMDRLPNPESDCHEVIDCWWIAMKNRIDGSDAPSADFIE
jgi:hypothetical protein